MPPAPDNFHVRLRNVSVAYGRRPVFRGLSCDFPRGRISVILGGSGSGKSTLLKVVAGLVRPDIAHPPARPGSPQAPEVLVDGTDITALGPSRMYQVRRRIGMVFQGGALLDSDTVFDNLALPLREHTRLPPAEVARQVHAALQAVDLADVDALLPGQLSGGMLRRVALARALIGDPDLLLCDEPFSGLDPGTTKRIEALLVRINRETAKTMIVVSHHVPTTLRMADLVLLLMDGRQIAGSPRELLRSKDAEVLDFLNEEAAAPAGV